jgi:hypothetical protein
MILELLGHALMITGFVFAMMVVIEYLNVLTRGNWDRVVARMRWGQSLLGSMLGATPGCLGSFAAASLYMHRILTFGALTATMIATSGDEAFVMLALFPKQALLLFVLLAGIGAATGILLDIILKSRRTHRTEHLEHYQAAHPETAQCIPFSAREMVRQWRHCSLPRLLLALFVVLFLAGVVSGRVGHHHAPVHETEPAHVMHDGHHEEHDHHAHDHAEQIDHAHHPGHEEHAAHNEPATAEPHAAHAHHGDGGWGWVRITLLVVGLIGLFIVITVPDHFLRQHLWNHIARVHIWRIFLWTIAALVVTHLLVSHIDMRAAVESHRLPILLLACLVGIIPQSGPHLIFATLYAQGAIPFSILLAGSIVQDGHGMIPVLAHSRRAFLAVKAVNLAVGLLVGLLGVLMGW